MYPTTAAAVFITMEITDFAAVNKTAKPINQRQHLLKNNIISCSQ